MESAAKSPAEHAALGLTLLLAAEQYRRGRSPEGRPATALGGTLVEVQRAGISLWARPGRAAEAGIFDRARRGRDA